MGLGANSCGIVASQLGAAPGARHGATWLHGMVVYCSGGWVLERPERARLRGLAGQAATL